MISNEFAAGAAGGIPAMIAAWFAYRASTRATAVSATKVESEAYERSKTFYESLLREADRSLDRLRAQVDRLNSQVDRLNLQLAQEQDVSQTLRRQIASLSAQVGTLEVTIGEIRRQLGGRIVAGQAHLAGGADDAGQDAG